MGKIKEAQIILKALGLPDAQTKRNVCFDSSCLM